MTLAGLASLAEIVASLGVIASLIFVAIQIRQNTQQTKLSNWGSVVDRYNTVYSHTNDLNLANLVAKGRKSYKNLTDGEKISFGHYLEQLCIANEGSLQFSAVNVHGQEDNLALFGKHIRFHLGFKGAREWFEEFEAQRGFPPQIAAAIHQAID
ncbi:MAG: hypothetical protein R3192_08850 [Woeseiaceae bacterium]|nr:hypothetical protein [Woeseiaceae bacterium]